MLKFRPKPRSSRVAIFLLFVFSLIFPILSEAQTAPQVLFRKSLDYDNGSSETGLAVVVSGWSWSDTQSSSGITSTKSLTGSATDGTITVSNATSVTRDSSSNVARTANVIAKVQIWVQGTPGATINASNSADLSISAPTGSYVNQAQFTNALNQTPFTIVQNSSNPNGQTQ